MEEGRVMDKQKVIIVSLLVVIAILSVSTVALYSQMRFMQHVETEPSRAFIFDWPREAQNVTDETLTINATFAIEKRDEGGLYAYFYHIIIIVNDDIPHS